MAETAAPDGDARVLLLTGTTGIAAETARQASRAGTRVFLVGIDEASGEALAETLRGEGGSCRFHRADVTVTSEVAAAVRSCVETHQRVDALFNVVGISGRRFGDGPIHECTDEGWDTTLTTNLRSVFLVCREVVRQMLTQPPDHHSTRGTILNMASVLAHSPAPRFFATHAYAASKAAIVGLSRSMAAYYAPHGIRVNAIAPALVRTPMSRRAQEDPAVVEFVRGKQPLTRELLDPADVARSALFLLGEGARAVTGQVLTVDAGWSVTG